MKVGDRVVIKGPSSWAGRCGHVVEVLADHRYNVQVSADAGVHLFFGEELEISKEGSAVDHPIHYNSLGAKCSACAHPIECIDVVRHMSFNLGNAVKYIYRCQFKGNELEDMRKARWYIEDAIRQLEARETK